MIEFFFCGLAFFLPKLLAKHEKQKVLHSQSVRVVLWHKFVTNDTWRFFVVVSACFIIHLLVIAPYQIYKGIAPENADLKVKLADRTKLLAAARRA